jgi:hypothetical protein
MKRKQTKKHRIEERKRKEKQIEKREKREKRRKAKRKEDKPIPNQKYQTVCSVKVLYGAMQRLKQAFGIGG